MTRYRDHGPDLFGKAAGFDPSPDTDDKVEKVKAIDLEMVLHYDTGKAVLVSDTGEESRAVWIPKSQCEIEKHDKTTNATKTDGQRVVLPVVTITMPTWLAKEKGLI